MGRRISAAFLMALILAACSTGATEVEVPIDAVVTLDVSDVSVTVDEDGKGEVALQVSASEGTPEIVIDTPPAHGKLTGSGLAYTYEPEADFSGADSVAFTAKVGEVTKSGRVTITVTPINDAPTFTPGGDVTVNEDSGAYGAAWATAVAAGPESEADQKTTFTVTTDDAALFSSPPAVAADGTLTFTPAADANGSATVTVGLKDDGGTTAGGIDTAADITFMITVTPVNDRPTFTAGSTIVVNEDSGAASLAGWATGMTAGPADEAGQTYSFSVTTDQPGLFSAAPALANNGTLTFTPAAQASGVAMLYVKLTDNGGSTSGGMPDSLLQAISLTVAPVNDAPSFTAGGNVAVNEDSGAYAAAWASNVSPGPLNEAAQAVTFGVTSTNAALFSAQPAVSAAGVLSFTPAANANGTATVSVTAYDDGGTANGGVRQSATATFTLTVNAVNDAPTFADAGNPVVAEDSGAASLANWATSISAGPNETQTYSFTVTTNAPTLFSAGPAVSNTGTLSFTPAADAFGAAQIYVRLQDDAGTALGGADTSTLHVATITISAKNDAPSFTKGADVVVDEDSGAYAAAWATAIARGPANEAAQTVTFSATTAQSALFAVQPAVAADGSLSFTPAADASGTATVNVRIYDDGGTAGGGVDASGTQTFTVTINAVNDAPAFSLGAAPTVAEDSGAASLTNFATGMSVGPADEAAQTYSFTVTSSNPAAFAAAPALSNAGTLTFTPAANAFGAVTLYVVMADSGGAPNTTAAQFTLTITPVNDPPTFVKGGNQNAAEDAGPVSVATWATQISPGAGETGAVVFVVSNDNAALFSSPPTVTSGGALSFETAPDAFGVATVTVRVKDDAGAQSPAQTFTINVVGVNDAPAFTAGANQSAAEDAGLLAVNGWATALSAGPANEAWQSFSFIVTTSNPALFAVAPAVSGAGTLAYETAANANGTAVVYVRMQDNGGTSLNGQNSTAVQTFTITATAVNDDPTFTDGGDKYALDTAGAQSYPGWAADILVGPADEAAAGQTYSFAVTNDANTLFSVQPAVDLSGALTFTPAVGQSGTANVAVTLGDNAGGSSLHTVRITVDGMNDAPSFVTGGTVAVLEDAGMYAAAWASGMSAGPGEGGQQLTFEVTNNTNPGLFAVQPAVGADGTLSFMTAADANGAAYVTVRLKDDGGTAGGGSDVSADEVFKIEVAAVNDKPVFGDQGEVSVFEDEGAVTIAGWAFGFNYGAPDETGQTLSFVVTAQNPALFAVAPAVDALGNLTFTTAPDAVGSTELEISAVDDGGTANGGENTSGSSFITVTLGPVNDAPTFTAGGDITIDEDDPLHVGQGTPWAADVAPGPADELYQGYMFEVTSSNTMLIANPWIDQNGWLHFWTNPDQSGTAVLYVTLADNGGTDNGGVDRALQTFTMTVNPVNDAPRTATDPLAVTVNSPGFVGVLFNDWDPDGDSLAVTGYTSPGHGTLLYASGFFQYTPEADYTGPDTFTYYAFDGTAASPGTVTVFVGPDTTAPNFVAAASNPQNGATLNEAQAMGAGIGGVPQLSPARFVFDDPFLDAANVDVAVEWQAIPLVQGASYWVDTSKAGELGVWADLWSIPSPPEGGLLTFTLSNIADTYGNGNPDPVVVSVWYDGVAPQPDWLTSSSWPYVRMVVQFPESMQPASFTSLLVEDTTAGAPISADEVNGFASFSLSKTDDAFYFVAGATVPPNHELSVDMSGLTDLAGNPVQGNTSWASPSCCSNPAPVKLVAVRFVDRDTSVVTATIAPGSFVNDAFAVPAAVAGSQDLVQLVFDQSLDPSRGDSELRGEDFKPNALRVDGTYQTTTLADDTLEFDPLDFDAGFTWPAGESFDLRADVGTPASGNGYAQVAFVVKGGALDVTAPTVVALGARRGVGTVPVLRGEESLMLTFSEVIDPATLTPGNITIDGPGGPVPFVFEYEKGLWGMRLRAAGPDGRPGAWPAGNLTLSLANLQDTASPANTITAAQFAVAVTPAATPAPVMTHFAQAGTVVTSPELSFSFSDLMSVRSFVDVGPAAARGFALEEKWGPIWVPLKGAQVRNDGFSTPGIVSMNFGGFGPWNAGRVYRLTWLPGLTNIDGVSIDAPAPVTFVTAGGGNAAPQLHDLRIEWQELGGGDFTFGGQALAPVLEVSAGLWDSDMGDSWELTLTSAAGSASSGWSTSMNPSVALVDAQLDDVFPRGESTPFMVAVSDSAGHSVGLLHRAYRLSADFAAQSAPTVTAAGAPGVFTISGTVFDPQDAAAIGEMGAFVSIVDTSVFPFDIVDVVGMYIGQVTRNADGTLGYSVTLPPERPLQTLPPPYMYMAAGIADVPLQIDAENRGIMAFTASSAPFNR